MPLDPSIYRGIVMPQFDRPSDAAARRLSLSSMAQRDVMQAQAIREHEMAFRQKQQEEQRREAVRQMMMEARGDPDLILKGMWELDPDRAPAVEAHFAELRTKAQKLRDDKLAARQKIEERITGNLAPLLGSQDTDVLNKDLAGAFARLSADPIVNEDPEAKEFIAQIPRKFESTGAYRKFLGSINQKIVDAHDENARKAAKESREVAGFNPETGLTRQAEAQLNKPTPHIVQTPEGAKVVSVTPQGAVTGNVDIPGTKPSKLLSPEEEAQRIRIAGANKPADVALPAAPAFSSTPGERNEDYLKQLSPGMSNQVKAIVEGRYPVPTGAALRSPQIMKLLEAASVYEPGFDLTQWQTRLTTRRDFATGKAATNIRSLNTLVDHAGKFMDATQALGNTLPRGLNWVGNTLKTQTVGNPQLANWGIASQAVISEAVSLFKGTGATNEEIAALRSHFNPNAPKNEQEAGIRTIIQLAFGRLGALEDQFQNAFRKPRDFKFLSPKSQKVLKDKLGLDPNALDSAPSEGNSAPSAPVGTGGAQRPPLSSFER